MNSDFKVFVARMIIGLWLVFLGAFVLCGILGLIMGICQFWTNPHFSYKAAVAIIQILLAFIALIWIMNWAAKNAKLPWLLDEN